MPDGLRTKDGERLFDLKTKVADKKTGPEEDAGPDE